MRGVRIRKQRIAREKAATGNVCRRRPFFVGRSHSVNSRRRWAMSDKGFLEAILENPDDEAVRLIYADWLDDHGQAERAEFIRIQCQLTREHERCDDWTALAAMSAREKELLDKHGKV